MSCLVSQGRAYIHRYFPFFNTDVTHSETAIYLTLSPLHLSFTTSLSATQSVVSLLSSQSLIFCSLSSCCIVYHFPTLSSNAYVGSIYRCCPWYSGRSWTRAVKCRHRCFYVHGPVRPATLRTPSTFPAILLGYPGVEIVITSATYIHQQSWLNIRHPEFPVHTMLFCLVIPPNVYHSQNLLTHPSVCKDLFIPDTLIKFSPFPVDFIDPTNSIPPTFGPRLPEMYQANTYLRRDYDWNGKCNLPRVCLS